MNTNIRKILYLGVGMLLLALAFTSFFSSYNQYQSYIDGSMKITQLDRTVSITEEKVYSYVPGYEVILLVLDKQKRAEKDKLSQDYFNTEYPHQNKCDVWVCGENVLSIDPATLEATALYDVFFEQDHWGNVINSYYFLQ